MSYRTGEADARGSGVQGPRQLCRELDASLGYMRLCSFKKKKKVFMVQKMPSGVFSFTAVLRLQVAPALCWTNSFHLTRHKRRSAIGLSLWLLGSQEEYNFMESLSQNEQEEDC